MKPVWEDFINELMDESNVLAKDELINLIKNTKSDSEDFLKRQGEKMELYIGQLAFKAISKEQFIGYMTDIKTLTEIQSEKMKIQAKARAQRLAKGIGNLILDRLTKLI